MKSSPSLGVWSDFLPPSTELRNPLSLPWRTAEGRDISERERLRTYGFFKVLFFKVFLETFFECNSGFGEGQKRKKVFVAERVGILKLEPSVLSAR